MNLKEFSNLLGLSPTTVSRALSGYPEVSEKTRLKVNEAARIHGYQPNLRARALALGRSYSIGHVLSSSNGSELVNPIFGDFISGAAEAGAARGYSINLTIAEQSSEESVFRKLKAQGSVAGIILQSPKVHDQRIELLKELGLKFVVHGRSSGVSIPYSWVDVNNHRAFEQATTFLAHMGHRRIGLINGRQDFDFAHRRLNGYLQALHAAGIEPHSDLQTSGDMTEANGYAAAKAMLGLECPATAFLAASVMSAIGARRAIHDSGMELPGDVSLIAYDDDLSYLSNRQSPPIFTAVRSSVREAGERAVTLLMSQIEGQKVRNDQLLLETELIVGMSTGPRKSVR